MADTTLLNASADSMSRLYTAEAVGLAVQIVRGDIPGAKAADRLRAAQLILDRGHGRAVQAVISVPARQAVAARLAAMSEDALLAIAARGSREQNGGPKAPGAAAGTPQERDEPYADSDLPTPRNGTPRPTNGALVPARFRHDEVTDAEYDIDPLG